MPAQSLSRRLSELLSNHAPWFATLLFAASVVVRYQAGKCVKIPTIYDDEWRYLEMARSFADGHPYYWGAFKTDFPCWIYPGLIAWPVTHLAYDRAILAIRWINALCMSLTVIVTYLFAIEVTTRVRALIAAFLVALLPSFVFTGTVMTENVYTPLFVLAMWLAFRAILKPTVSRCLLAGIVAALPLHAKPQGILVPLVIAATVIVFEAERLMPVDGESRGRRLGAFVRGVSAHWLTAFGFVLGYMPRILEIVFYEHPHERFQTRFLMGFYHGMGFHEAGFNAGSFFTSLTSNFIGWIVACGFIPAFVLARVAWASCKTISGTAPESAFRPDRAIRLLALQSVVAMIGGVILNARHIMLSSEPPIIYERYLMVLIPMALILFVAVGGILQPSRAGIRTGLLTLLVVVIMIRLTQYDIRVRWSLSSAAPSIAGMMLLFTEPKPIYPFIWMILTIAATISLFCARGRFDRTVAAVALLFFSMNVGIYLFDGKVAGFVIREDQRFARKIAKKIGPDGKLVIWGDGLERKLLQPGFRNPGRMVFISPYADNHWMADRLKLDAAGHIQSPFPIERSYLAAAGSIKFNRKPILHMKGGKDQEGVKVYKMDGLAVEKPLPGFIQERLDAWRQ